MNRPDSDLRYVVASRDDGSVSYDAVYRDEVPARISALGQRGYHVLGVARSCSEADELRHDYKRVCKCKGGKGSFRCEACQSWALVGKLRASVQTTEKNQAQRDPLALIRGGL